jgi:hypothetical protein
MPLAPKSGAASAQSGYSDAQPQPNLSATGSAAVGTGLGLPNGASSFSDHRPTFLDVERGGSRASAVGTYDPPPEPSASELQSLLAKLKALLARLLGNDAPAASGAALVAAVKRDMAAHPVLSKLDFSEGSLNIIGARSMGAQARMADFLALPSVRGNTTAFVRDVFEGESGIFFGTDDYAYLELAYALGKDAAKNPEARTLYLRERARLANAKDLPASQRELLLALRDRAFGGQLVSETQFKDYFVRTLHPLPR